MVYDIEFIRHVDGKAETQALDAIKLVGDSIVAVIDEAERWFREIDTVPRPDGFRIREGNGGDIVYEHREPQRV
jgi:hypothetical protein